MLGHDRPRRLPSSMQDNPAVPPQTPGAGSVKVGAPAHYPNAERGRGWRALGRRLRGGGDPESIPSCPGVVEAPKHGEIGIACAGGRIRSAGFSIGVLHRLRGEGVLRSSRYLAGVSGGSDIAPAFWIVRRALLGTLACLALLSACGASAQALDVPAIETLGHEAETIHPQTLQLPHVTVASKPGSEFGTDDLRITGALDQDKTNLDASVTDAAEKATDGDAAGEDAIRKCMAAGMLAIISEVLEGSHPSVEEALRTSMNPCFKKFAGHDAQRALALTEYFSKKATEQANQAYADSRENAVVFGNWVRRTAATIEGSGQASQSTTETTPQPGPEPKKGGSSIGGIVALVIVVVGIASGIAGFRIRRKQRGTR